MNIKEFLDFVELRTKIASMFPFIFGTIYTLYATDNFYFDRFLLMFLSLICIDMATTAINHYVDYVKSNIDEYKTKENVIGEQKLNLKTSKNIILTLIGLAIIFGLILVAKTNIIVLLIGVVSFCIGVFYTFGPMPISRTPFGEVLSGFFMGFIILFLTIYIHNTEMVSLILVQEFNILTFAINYAKVISIFLVSVPFILCIANIMVANNTCDIEMDAKNNRFLLPHYIGVKNSVLLFKYNYYISYVFIVLCVILNLLPLTSLLALLSIGIVQKNINIFTAEQIKSKTFICAVKNFIVISIFSIIGLSLGLLF